LRACPTSERRREGGTVIISDNIADAISPLLFARKLVELEAELDDKDEDEVIEVFKA
jgi:hypothetical protein